MSSEWDTLSNYTGTTGISQDRLLLSTADACVAGHECGEGKESGRAWVVKGCVSPPESLGSN